MVAIEQVVIAAFPASGKTYLAERYPELCDSDSSKFSWVWPHPGMRVRHPEWPDNYLRHIKNELAAGRTVLTSTHREVRALLYETRLPFHLVYPHEDLLEEWLERMRQRGDRPGLIGYVKQEWAAWHLELRLQGGCVHHVLGSGEFIPWPL